MPAVADIRDTEAVTQIPGPVNSVLDGLRGAGYLADATIATVVHLGAELGKPVLVEGRPGPARPSWPSRLPRRPASG